MTVYNLEAEYNRHLRNAAMYRAEAERKLDRRYHPACVAGDMAYARWHEAAADALRRLKMAKVAAPR